MVNCDYRIDAMNILLNEDCILKGFYPLIPYRSVLVDKLTQMGCKRKSDVQRCSDQILQQAGLPDMGLVVLFRKFLTMYDPKTQKMREIDAVSEMEEEAKAFEELYLLPGVKSTRARLYMRAGFHSLMDIASVSAEELIEACKKTIDQKSLKMKAPLLKEAKTHIAVAKAFTDLL